MKVRSGFVSNSSSSSFIVFNDDSIIPNPILYVKLNKEQKIKLIQQGFIDSVKDDIFLTQFISDGYDGDDFHKFYEATNKKVYQSGSHFGPYWEEYYVEISDQVWLHTATEEINED